MTRPKNLTLEQTVAAVRLRHGPTALRTAQESPVQIPSLPTGYAALDAALGIGGLPRGQISELFGPLTAGKTTLAANLVVQAQRRGLGAAWLDLASAADPDYLARCGVDLPALPIIRPTHSRQALEIALALAARREVGVIVLDAVNDLCQTPLDAHWAAGALRQLAARLRRSSGVLLALYHCQDGILHYPPGLALEEQAWLRLQMRAVQWLRRREAIYGYEAEVVILRHRNGREGRRIRIPIEWSDPRYS